jgi:hypothetical protein
VNSASDTEHSYGSLLDYSSSNEINSHSVVILRHLRERLSPSHRILSFLSLSHPVSPFAPPHRLATVPSSLTINRSRCLRRRAVSFHAFQHTCLAFQYICPIPGRALVPVPCHGSPLSLIPLTPTPLPPLGHRHHPPLLPSFSFPLLSDEWQLGVVASLPDSMPSGLPSKLIVGARA